MYRTILAVLVAVFISASVNALRAQDIPDDVPVKFQTVLDPKASGCKNPTLETEQSGVYQIDDGRFGVLVIFLCGDKEVDRVSTSP